MFIFMLQIVYFLVPTYCSNMAAVMSAKLFPQWDAPIVPERVHWRGKSVLGANKTWRGLIFGTIIGMIVYVIQSWFTTGLEIHSYSLILGFLLSFGAVFGDVIESFFKRRLNIGPGKPFIPFDQIDHSVMALLLALTVFPDIVTWKMFFAGIAITFVGHILSNFIAYHIHLRKTLW